MKIAVAMHLYYLDLYDELKSYLKNLVPFPYDLYVTLPKENIDFHSNLEKDFPNVRIIITENIGFDIYPFLCFLNVVPLDQYDLIFKIHSKKDIPINYCLNGYDFSGSAWRLCLLSSILGSTERVKKIIELFEQDPKLGLIGPAELLIKDDAINCDIDMNKVEMFMKECGLSINKLEFIAGTMFVIRSELLEPLIIRNFKADEFPSYFPRDWNGLPYCLERIFTLMVSSQGYQVKTFPSIFHIKKSRQITIRKKLYAIQKVNKKK